MNKTLLLLGCGLVLLLLPGCFGSGPAMGYVEGTVTLNGEPLPSARVTFQPTEVGGSPSTGITDEQGHYELQFSKDRKGALVGTHQIRISTFAQSNDGKPPLPERVPAEYNDQTTLIREVKAGSQVIDFPLKGTVSQGR